MTQEEMDAETRIAIVRKNEARVLRDAKKGGQLFDIFKEVLNLDDLDFPYNPILAKLWSEIEQHFLDHGYDICDDCSKCEDCDERR